MNIQSIKVASNLKTGSYVPVRLCKAINFKNDLSVFNDSLTMTSKV